MKERGLIVVFGERSAYVADIAAKSARGDGLKVLAVGASATSPTLWSLPYRDGMAS